jgi:glutamate-1-semialdehyde 2,1-aminomutase
MRSEDPVHPSRLMPESTPASRAALAAAVHSARAAYSQANPASRQQIAAASAFLPGGNTRSVLHYAPFPLVMEQGAGCRLWDLDGHEYLDFLGEFTAGLYGHSNDIVRGAVTSALGAGVNMGAPGRMEAELGRLLCGRFPSLQLVRFTNSGTEANLLALAAATTFTGRSKILVFTGAYHGGVLAFARGGSPVNVPHDFLLGIYNDRPGTESLIDAHGDGLAAILVEPMLGSGGCIPGDPEFLRMLRRRATAVGAVLIFDEVMTSRLGVGGCQGLINVIPDLTVLGKYIGGGMSIGAFGGRRDIMSQFDPQGPQPLAHAGTFNNNAVTMAAGVAALSQLYTPAAAQALNARGDVLRDRLNQLARDFEAPLQWTGLGSLMNLHCTHRPIRSSIDVAQEDALLKELFFFDMLRQGIYLARRGFIALSLCIGDSECERLIAAVTTFLRERRHLMSQKPSPD